VEEVRDTMEEVLAMVLEETVVRLLGVQVDKPDRHALVVAAAAAALAVEVAVFCF
jgi:hypothetical protein